MRGEGGQISDILTVLCGFLSGGVSKAMSVSMLGIRAEIDKQFCSLRPTIPGLSLISNRRPHITCQILYKLASQRSQR